jgi:orotidine-5'-phosphate decarboxylase
MKVKDISKTKNKQSEAYLGLGLEKAQLAFLGSDKLQCAICHQVPGRSAVVIFFVTPLPSPTHI